MQKGLTTSFKKQELWFLAIAITSLIVLLLFQFVIDSTSFQFLDKNFLLIYTLLELFSIYVSFSIFVLARVTFSINPHYFFIGLLFLTVGSFDLLHTLTYKGMPFFNDQFAITQATTFWIIARLTESIGLAIFILNPKLFLVKSLRISIGLTLIIISIISSIILIFTENLPVLVRETIGLTPLKIKLEYFIVITHLLSLTILLRKYRSRPDIDSLRLIFSIFLMMVGELFFTFYNNVYDIENIIGLMYRFAAYLYLYRSLFFPYIKYILTSKEEAEKKQKEAEQKLDDVEKNFAQQIFSAHEEERKRVSRELHDGIGQSLYSILITLYTARKENSPEQKDAILETAQKITENAMKETKEIAYSLRPSSLDDLGFVPTLRSYLEYYKKIHHIPIKFEITGNVERLSPEIETALYRICQEALLNSAKYANPSLIEVSIHIKKNDVFLTIKDSGNGFLVDDYFNNKGKKGIGLYSIKERAEGLGGSANIHSELNVGTTITIHIPRNEFS